MAKQGAILVGTIGQGVMRTLDGETWTRASVLLAHPHARVPQS
jgi:lipid-binding SYLF domain-containing protein